MNLLYILHTSPWSDLWFANIFSSFLSSLFVLLTGSFPEHSFNFDESSLSIFSFYSSALGVKSQNLLLILRSMFSPVLSRLSFGVHFCRYGALSWTEVLFPFPLDVQLLWPSG